MSANVSKAKYADYYNITNAKRRTRKDKEGDWMTFLCKFCSFDHEKWMNAPNKPLRKHLEDMHEAKFNELIVSESAAEQKKRANTLVAAVNANNVVNTITEALTNDEGVQSAGITTEDPAITIAPQQRAQSADVSDTGTQHQLTSIRSPTTQLQHGTRSPNNRADDAADATMLSTLEKKQQKKSTSARLFGEFVASHLSQMSSKEYDQVVKTIMDVLHKPHDEDLNNDEL